jgi:hypothetical protein
VNFTIPLFGRKLLVVISRSFMCGQTIHQMVDVFTKASLPLVASCGSLIFSPVWVRGK